MIKLRGWTFASPVAVSGPSDGCHFYHWMDLPTETGVETQAGVWDLRGRYEDYLGGINVRGKSVLDVGAANGWISFEVERHGAAEVVGLDMAADVKPQYVPYIAFTDRDAPKTADPDAPASPPPSIERGYWLCHRLYGSSARLVHGNIYHVGDHVFGADIVIVGQILVHQRDPLEALLQCARAAGETLVIVEGSFEFDRPVMLFGGLGGNYYSWFLLSTTMYAEYLKILGFEVTSMTKNSYRCHHVDAQPDMEVWTIVATRVGPTQGRMPPA